MGAWEFFWQAGRQAGSDEGKETEGKKGRLILLLEEVEGRLMDGWRYGYGCVVVISVGLLAWQWQYEVCGYSGTY